MDRFMADKEDWCMLGFWVSMALTMLGVVALWGGGSSLFPLDGNGRLPDYGTAIKIVTEKCLDLDKSLDWVEECAERELQEYYRLKRLQTEKDQKSNSTTTKKEAAWLPK